MSTITDFKSAFTDSVFRTKMHSSGGFMPVHMSAFIARKCWSDNIYVKHTFSRVRAAAGFRGAPQGRPGEQQACLIRKASCCQHSECWVCSITLTSSRHPQTPRGKELFVVSRPHFSYNTVSRTPCCLSARCNFCLLFLIIPYSTCRSIDHV